MMKEKRNINFFLPALRLLRTLLRLAAIFLVLCLIQLFPLQANAIEPCEIEIDPIWNEADQLQQSLANDPFAAAFEQFIKDFKQNREELHKWIESANDYRNRVCLPYQRDLTNYEARRPPYERQCTGTITDPKVFADCQSEYRLLAEWKGRLDRKLYSELRPAEERLNSRGQELLTKEKRAVERAKHMIGPGNLKNAFHLFALKMSKDVGAGRISSCEALALMSEALGPKVGWEYGKFAAMMGQVLATEANPMVFDPTASSASFNASGFKSEFVGYQKDNQVRHFVAYFMLGTEFGETAADIVSVIQDRLRLRAHGREPQEFDYKLAIAAGTLGRDVARQPSRLRSLGSTIRAKICR